MAYNAKKLIEYESPFWASKLCYIPLYYVKLAQRATAVAARHLGLSSYLFLRCDEGTQPDVQLLACTGGIFGTYDGCFNNLLEQERCINEDVMTWAAYQTLMNGEKK
ncbi:uncharacterized protein TRIADDRAFT_53452 [Trichoplax adhaerens]|uniref:Uncharacterized protein n=1 Tax=Trichoplax adhaerens TaxID=10228 RepID=B3RP96_TRIAD|nr:hypothetical protein TRIADDRAFT_53452 [Trichoplax adhaerens]EDV27596.1 hypothetical protein TRIADDRAFT_53452 [Trichoplax adhaerens]|eukprot:XP_002109430.1 hypothetical protein TRIADDRAFT_53452 [Trichoplax adhaerens]